MLPLISIGTYTNSRLCVSVRDYYCYKFQIRRGVFNTMLYGKRLFQQYVVDMYIKVESSRLDYIRNHQKQIRANLYQGVVDSLQAGENRADEVGKWTILPTSFIGGKRDRRRRYLDAMALVQKYGKPDIFLTMTCNPNWDEIISELEPGQTPQDRPDLIVRVFRAKLEDLKIQLFKKHMLGKVAAYVYVVEFQKRGLPHAASILPGGRTAHSRFKIPLNIEDGGVCSFTKQSGTAKLLMSASLIIWDEASMTRRQAVEALDNSMRDIMAQPDLPFGGKTVVFGGDFRQVLPVVRKGTRSQIIDATLRKSYLWESMRHIRLVRNMRAQSDPWFADYLLRVGNGTEDTTDDGYIRLPDEICVPYTGVASDIDKLIESVFPMTLDENLLDPNYITSRAILSTRNE